jgi:YVTN family beta-propeller protein
VINAATNKVITTLNGIEGAHNLQVAPDGKTVWALSGHEALAVMLDASTYKVHGVVPIGMEPAHIILLPDGKTAYATNGDVDSMTTVASIPVGEFPHGRRPSPDGRWVYVANAKSTTLGVIDTQSNTKVADIEVGERPVSEDYL